MNKQRLLIIVSCIALAGGAADLYRRNLGAPDRGMPGLDFVIPNDYTLVRLPEATLPEAAAQLLATLDTHPLAAVEYSDRGSKIQLLADVSGELIDERGSGRQGTVRRVLWHGPVRQRLEHARDQGTLEAPGLPAPERRNPYH